MPRKYWWSNALPLQLGTVTNILATIPTYGPILGMTQAEIDRIILICETYIAVYNYADTTKAASKATNEWRDNCFEGPETKDLAEPPAPATFTMPVGAFTNIVGALKKERDQIVEMDNFTDAIGEAMGLLGEETSNVNPGDLVASLTSVTAKPGSVVEVKFSLQGQSSMALQYRLKGEVSWKPAGDPTSSPYLHVLAPQVPDTPELREYRGILQKKNVQVGSPSPIMTVVTTP